MRAVLQIVVSCMVLGLGVALLLLAALGADGYSTLVSGVSRASGVPFWLTNLGLGAVLIGLAWTRGLRPGVGTLLQPLVVGLTVSGVLAVLTEPSGLAPRILVLAAAFTVLALGVAGYLAVEAGAGPAEALGLAFEPAVPFAASYTAVQVGGALVGWRCGADVGVGTLLVATGVGPLVATLRPRLPQPRLSGRPGVPAPRR